MSEQPTLPLLPVIELGGEETDAPLQARAIEPVRIPLAPAFTIGR